MTIIEAITRLDDLKFNTYSKEIKRSWLSALDMKIHQEIIQTHEGSDGSTFSGYTEKTPDSTVLLVPEPYDEIYLRWMEAQVDYHNGEFDKYNASIIMFNTALTQFSNRYNHLHRPIPRGRRFLF